LYDIGLEAGRFNGGSAPVIGGVDPHPEEQQQQLAYQHKQGGQENDRRKLFHIPISRSNRVNLKSPCGKI